MRSVPYPSVPVFDAQTIERFYHVLVTAQFGTVVRMVAGIGLMGLALTMVGLYGLVSYAVSRRTREIGIRMASLDQRQRLQQLFFPEGIPFSGKSFDRRGNGLCIQVLEAD